MECMAGKMRGGDVMRIRAKNTATIMLISFLVILILGIFLCMFLFKGIQQDKSFSGAKYVYQNPVENKRCGHCYFTTK